jgi:acyl-coenzyme A thioesterase PaaI-like protein
MEVDFLYPVMRGWVLARATVTHTEKRTWDADVSLYDDGREVMRMHAILKLARRQPNLSQAECDAIPGEIISARVATD